MKCPSEGTGAKFQRPPQANSGREPREKVTILRKKFSAAVALSFPSFIGEFLVPQFRSKIDLHPLSQLDRTHRTLQGRPDDRGWRRGAKRRRRALRNSERTRIYAVTAPIMPRVAARFGRRYNGVASFDLVRHHRPQTFPRNLPTNRRLCSTVGGRIVEGWTAHCCAVSAARSRAATMTNLARSSLALALPALFGAAKSCALVNLFMICPPRLARGQPATTRDRLSDTFAFPRPRNHIVPRQIELRVAIRYRTA